MHLKIIIDSFLYYIFETPAVLSRLHELGKLHLQAFI